jgi:hypothetical protein
MCHCSASAVSEMNFKFLTKLFRVLANGTLCLYLDVHNSGDRTPKQKVKMKVTQERLLNLMLKYNGGRPRAEVSHS